MKTESNEAVDEHKQHEAIARAYREASDAVDAKPDARVRAAVLAAAARAVDAKPHDAARHSAAHPFGVRRWPLSVAALLVVSVMTGLVVTRGWWERPDLVEGNPRQDETPQVPAQISAPEANPPAASTAKPQSAVTIGPSNGNADKSERDPRHKQSEPQRRASAVTAPKETDKQRSEAPAAAAPNPVPVPEPNTMSRKPAASASDSAFASAPSPIAQPSPPTVSEREGTPRANTGAIDASKETTRTDASASAKAPRGAAALRSPDEGARAKAEVEPNSPEAWVARIVKLREAGNDEQADREVALLKQRYPNFAIPREALRATGTR